MASVQLLSLHPTLKRIAVGDDPNALLETAYTYLENKFGWVDEFDVRWFWSQHKCCIRHLRSPRFNFFEPDMEIRDIKPQSPSRPQTEDAN